MLHHALTLQRIFNDGSTSKKALVYLSILSNAAIEFREPGTYPPLWPLITGICFPDSEKTPALLWVLNRR